MRGPQDSFKEMMARARGEQVIPFVKNPFQASETVRTAGVAERKTTIATTLSPEPSAQDPTSSLVTVMDTNSASVTSEPSLQKTKNQQPSEPSNKKTTVADAIKPVLSRSPPFVTSAKRKRLENEAADVFITKTVTKVPKLAPPPTYEELTEENKKLKIENHQLRLARDKVSKADKVISNFVTSASIMETAADVREIEMRKGLNSMSEAVTMVQNRLAEMIKYSNSTTDIICRIIHGAGNDPEIHLSKAEGRRLQRLYENAKPEKEVSEVLQEKLSFTPKARGKHYYGVIDTQSKPNHEFGDMFPEYILCKHVSHHMNLPKCNANSEILQDDHGILPDCGHPLIPTASLSAKVIITLVFGFSMSSVVATT